MSQAHGPDIATLEAVEEVALAAPDLDSLLRGLIGSIVGLSGAGAGVILGLEGERLVPYASCGLDDGALAGYDLPRGAGLCGRALESGRPQSTTDVRHDGAGWLPGLRERGIKSILCVPLKAPEGVIGVAQIELREARAFADQEVRRFEAVADRAAISIAHARLARERQELAAQLEHTKADLRHVDRIKTDFLSMVSHELRTPLTAIIGYTDLLLRGTHGQLNERQCRHQRAVKLGSQRLLALINDLLDASRLDSGLIELDLTEVSLNSVLDQALSDLRESAADGRLSLRVELPAKLPTVRGDHARLVQVVSNLLANSIKFTPPEGRVDMRAEVIDEGRRVRVGVADTGAGIAPEHLAHIWDRFYQADSSVRRRYGGTGLGLAIVRQLVELHGGSVQATSAGTGQGATFSFDLQVYEPAAVGHPTSDLIPPQTADDRRHTVLVVEDQPDNRELLATMLQEMLDVHVITAADGIEALERAEQQPDLILLDLLLPRLDGFKVVRRLKSAAHTRHIPVLALTALTRPTERDEARAAGCDGLIVKPFDTDNLIQTVEKHLSRAADKRQP